MTFDRNSWFDIAFGFKESEANVKNNIEIFPETHSMLIKPKSVIRKFGEFKIKSLSDYPEPSLFPGSFKIVIGNGRRTKHIEKIDSKLMQFDNKKYNGSTFQVASNFNCLEFMTPFQKRSEGITNYAFDPTQGPNCCLACPYSILWRNYFMEPVNLLDETDICVDPPGSGYPLINSSHRCEYNFDKLKFKVGVQYGCEVFNEDIFVNHVFCASLSFGQGVQPSELNYALNFELLKVEYRLTILAAMESNSNYLILTLLGAGVFKAPINDIIRAIEYNMDLILNSGLKVKLIIFDGNRISDSLIKRLSKYGSVKYVK